MPENVTHSTTSNFFDDLNNVNFVNVMVNTISVPFAYRAVDLPIVKDVFEKEEHFIPIDNFQPKLILDCGGNIGSTALYYTIKYPNAQIYSIEPEKNNFRLLKYKKVYS